MIDCPDPGCPVNRRALAIVAELNGDLGRAKCNAYFELHETCSRCGVLKHWERFEDGSAREMRPKQSDAA